MTPPPLRTYVLVDDALDLQRLHHVGDELRVGVGVPDLLVEQSPDAALWADTPTLNRTSNHPHFAPTCRILHLELGADGLRFVADVQDGNFT